MKNLSKPVTLVLLVAAFAGGYECAKTEYLDGPSIEAIQMPPKITPIDLGAMSAEEADECALDSECAQGAFGDNWERIVDEAQNG